MEPYKRGNTGLKMANTLEDKHRIFLQFMMAKKTVKSNELRHFFQKHCLNTEKNVPNINEILQPFVQVINHHLRPLHLEIKKGFEENGHPFYALINTMDSSITRLSTFYTVPELEFFKKLLLMILGSEGGEIPSSTALNATDQLEHRITKSQAQEFMKKFIDNGIFSNNNGIISLTPYCLLELDSFLKKHYKDYLKFCNLCKQIVLKDRSCDECSEKFHLHCVNSFFKNKGLRNCPTCKAKWSEETEEIDTSQTRSRKKRVKT